MDKLVLQVCFLSPDSGLGEAIARALGAEFLTRTSCEVQPERLQEILKWCDVVLLDLRSENNHEEEPDWDLLDRVNSIACAPPVVVLCDAENRGLLLGAIEHGSSDCVINPPNIIELRLILRRAYRFQAAQQEIQRLRLREQSAGKLQDLLGTAPAMQELFALTHKIAQCDVNVLITGETGTGKELLARAVHQMSSRTTGPLVAFSCANLPETLVEDELFGHERGAFTGALAARRGRVEAADHGTLFLDEVGDLALGLQPKLLRVIQEKRFERLGSNKTVNVDIRLICATNRNLGEMVQQGNFREDLFYRLNVVELHLPALRERLDDIPLLAQHFLQRSAQQFQRRAKRFSPAALRALEEHPWPGNVRELENVVQRAVVLSEGETLEPKHLPAALRNSQDKTPADGANGEGSKRTRSYEEEIKRFKRSLILRTLRECGWRKAESARALGVARGYLHRLIHQLGIQEEEADPSFERQRDVPPLGPVM